jgi:hypothetical protein
VKHESPEDNLHGSARPDNERTYGPVRQYKNIVVALRYNGSRHLRVDGEFEFPLPTKCSYHYSHLHPRTGSSRFQRTYLTGGGSYSIGVGIGVFAGSTVANSSSITIENGKLQNFGFGVWAEIAGVYLTNVEVNNIAFSISQTPNNASAGVLLSQVNTSTISNCTFFAADTGIEDNQSRGGNIYTNNSFIGTGECLSVIGQNNGVPTILQNCRFGGPTN